MKSSGHLSHPTIAAAAAMRFPLRPTMVALSALLIFGAPVQAQDDGAGQAAAEIVELQVDPVAMTSYHSATMALLHKSREGFISRIQGGSWDA